VINKNNNKIKPSKAMQRLRDSLIKLDPTEINLLLVISSGRSSEEGRYVRPNCALFSVKMAIDSLGITRVVKQPFNYFSCLISPLLGDIPYHYPLVIVAILHLSCVAATEPHWNIYPQSFTYCSETPRIGCCQREGVSL